jgi:hypothetical protein
MYRLVELAYESDSSARFEASVRPFPNTSARHWRVSTVGGTRPVWTPNGGELLFSAPDGALMRVAVEATATMWAEAPGAGEIGRRNRMWSIETRWFDVAVFMSLYTACSILFGHFEQHKPAWRRLLKAAIFLGVLLGLAQTAGRAWAYGVLALLLTAAASVHFWWLSKHGINGWTGEPRDKYLALVEGIRDRDRA